MITDSTYYSMVIFFKLFSNLNYNLLYALQTSPGEMIWVTRYMQTTATYNQISHA